MVRDLVNERRSCPVCGSANLEPVHRTLLIPEQPHDPSVLAYRCDNGHMFANLNHGGALSSDALD